MKKNGLSELVFSLLLFLMFVIGSFFMIYYGGNIYNHIVNQGSQQETIEIPLAYLSNKLYAAKSKDDVEIKEIDNIDVLMIKNDTYITCVYQKDGHLKELNILDVEGFNADAGVNIYDVDDLKMSYKDDMYNIELVNNDISKSLSIYLR